jgi:isoleucyl-tRNA synthetase
MSKSLGNTVDPNKVCNQYGADILRLWVASVEYRADMPMSMDLLKQVSESYRKIRNTLKFLLTNISDFDKSKALSYDELNPVDKYMFIKLNEYIKRIYDCYDNFDFNDAYKETMAYVSTTLSAFYLDFTKDILYIEDPKSHDRLSTQTVFYYICDALIKVLSPIIPHTMSEAYDASGFNEAEDVYLTRMPKVCEITDEMKALEASFDKFMKYRDQINKALEDARSAKVIGKSFNALVTVTLDKEAKECFDSLKSNIGQILIVSQYKEVLGDKFDVLVEPAKGYVCARCWAIVPSVDEGDLCPRCRKIVSNLNK